MFNVKRIQQWFYLIRTYLQFKIHANERRIKLNIFAQNDVFIILHERNNNYYYFQFNEKKKIVNFLLPISILFMIIFFFKKNLLSFIVIEVLTSA